MSATALAGVRTCDREAPDLAGYAMPGRAIRSLSAAHSLLDELRAHAPWPPAAVMALGAHATAQYLHMALSSEQGAICYSLQVSAGGRGAGAFVLNS